MREQSYPHELGENGSREASSVRVDCVGYIRKSRSGKALKVTLIVNNIDNAVGYEGKDGAWYVGALINMSKLLDLLEGRRGVITINHVRSEAKR